jgi:hypothetical protein
MRSSCCLCVCGFVYPPIIARQRLGEHVPAATNTHTKMELLDAVSSMLSLSYLIHSMQLILPRTTYLN